MEQLPRRIAQIEKRRAVTVFEKAAIFRDLERPVKSDGRPDKGNVLPQR